MLKRSGVSSRAGQSRSQRTWLSDVPLPQAELRLYETGWYPDGHPMPHFVNAVPVVCSHRLWLSVVPLPQAELRL
jgi:hypothetical protein